MVYSTSPVAPFFGVHSTLAHLYSLHLILIFSDVFASYFVSLNEGPSALHARSRLLFMWTLHLPGGLVWEAVPVLQVM